VNIDQVEAIAHIEVRWVRQFFVHSDIVGIHITSSIVDWIQPARNTGDVAG
jgi:hypothetical protein